MKKGVFLSNLYEELGSPSHDLFQGECVWNSNIQTKAYFLLWKLWWNRIPTIDNLVRRGMVLFNWCCLCKEDAESSDHIFLHCVWTSTFLNYFTSRFGVRWVQPMTIKGLLPCWPKQYLISDRSKCREIWLMVPAAIWEGSNKRVFENMTRELRIILDDILAIWLATPSQCNQEWPLLSNLGYLIGRP